MIAGVGGQREKEGQLTGFVQDETSGRVNGQGGARIERFTTVDGLIVYDVPGAAASGGGTRLAADVTDAEMLLLARAMTYKLAVLELPFGGAKIGLRATPDERDDVIARFRVEVAGRLAAGTLMTGPDLGTAEADFAGLPVPGDKDGVATTTIGGLPAEELLTGMGVAAALNTALDGELEGRSVALEGFGKMGASIARAVTARGGRIVAVSTVDGCVVAAPGDELPLSQLLDVQQRWGDALVHHLNRPVHRPPALWSVDCDALVPGARPGVLDERTAQRVVARVVVPVANAPYTGRGLKALRARGIDAHADFVASAGGAMAYLSPRVAGARDAGEARAAVDELMSAIVTETRSTTLSPYGAAAAMAEGFVRSWVGPSDWQAWPPLA
jgi:glutamate dehydrogenase/leucine dehydrogenase